MKLGEGRKSYAEFRPELVALVRQLRRKRPKGGQRSPRKITAELAQRGIMNERGVLFSASSIKLMLIPNPIDQNPWAHWRSPMDMMRQG